MLASRAVKVRRVAAALARRLEHQVRAPHLVGAGAPTRAGWELRLLRRRRECGEEFGL